MALNAEQLSVLGGAGRSHAEQARPSRPLAYGIAEGSQRAVPWRQPSPPRQREKRVVRRYV